MLLTNKGLCTLRCVVACGAVSSRRSLAVYAAGWGVCGHACCAHSPVIFVALFVSVCSLRRPPF